MRAFVALAMLLAPAAVAARAQPDWRRVASDADRARLRGWRDAWVAALALLPPGTAARDPALFDPDRTLAEAMPSAGTYRCRFHRLPDRAGAPLRVERWQPCVVKADGDRLRLVVEAGDQRPVGFLYPDTASRAVFLGALAIGDEPRALAYGRDRLRDTAGLVERIAEQRWRLVLPGNGFGRRLDLMELAPG